MSEQQQRKTSSFYRSNSVWKEVLFDVIITHISNKAKCLHQTEYSVNCPSLFVEEREIINY